VTAVATAAFAKITSLVGVVVELGWRSSGAGAVQPLAAGPHSRDAALGVGEHPQGVAVENGQWVTVVGIAEGMPGGLLETEPVLMVLGVWVIVCSVAAPAERLGAELGVVGVGTEVDFVSVAAAAGIVLVGAAVAAGVVVDFGDDTA